jgi:hypothetical protein
MDLVRLKKLKESKTFLEQILWDITPKIFFQPRSTTAGEQVKSLDNREGYMLYVDIVFKKPVIVIMRVRELMSRTVGYIDEVPEALLQEAMLCSSEECISGMYPLTKDIEHWLKQELGLT